MSLEGTVTNVAAFGAFVDIGVHQDGLVHVSQLADRFVKDPHEVVKAGDIVRVRVVEVDVARNRIGLTMRKDGGARRRASPRQARGTRKQVAKYRQCASLLAGRRAEASVLPCSMRCRKRASRAEADVADVSLFAALRASRRSHHRPA